MLITNKSLNKLDKFLLLDMLVVTLVDMYKSN